MRRLTRHKHINSPGQQRKIGQTNSSAVAMTVRLSTPSASSTRLCYIVPTSCTTSQQHRHTLLQHQHRHTLLQHQHQPAHLAAASAPTGTPCCSISTNVRATSRSTGGRSSPRRGIYIIMRQTGPGYVTTCQQAHDVREWRNMRAEQFR